MPDAIVNVIDGRAVVRVSGSELVSPYVEEARKVLQRLDEYTTGPAGPSNNTRVSLAALKGAAVTDKTSLYDGSLWTWTPGDFTGQADDLNIVKADSTPLSQGAWVRQQASSIAVDGMTLDEVLKVGIYPVERNYPPAVRAAVAAGLYAASANDYIDLAIAAAAAGSYASLQFGPGTHPIDRAIKSVPDLDIVGHPTPGRTVIKSLNAMPNIVELGGFHQGQSLWLRAGSAIADITFDQNGFGGGVVAYDEAGIFCRRVEVRNGPNTGGNQAFLMTGVVGGAIEDCRTHRVQFSAQIYGCAMFDTIRGEFRQSYSGPFYAGSTDCQMTGVKCYDMEDVGCDVEGGRNMDVQGNYAEGCANGEFSLFPDLTGAGIGCHNISFTNNKFLRRAVYLHRDGTYKPVNPDCAALQVQGISPNSTLIYIANNHGVVNADAGSFLLIDGWGGSAVQDVRIGPNPCRYEGTGPAIATPVGTPGLQLVIDIGCTAAQEVASYVKNMSAGSVSGIMRFGFVPDDYGLILYSDTPQGETCVVDNLKIHGAGEKAVKVDQFNSPAGTYTLGPGCDFNASGPAVANGGLTVTSNGVPYTRGYVRRRLDTSGGTSSVYDFANDDLVGTEAGERPVVNWRHDIIVDGALRNVFEGTYASASAGDGVARSRDGTGTGQGQLADAANYVAVSGSTVTTTRQAGTNTSTYTLSYTTGAA